MRLIGRLLMTSNLLAFFLIFITNNVFAARASLAPTLLEQSKLTQKNDQAEVLYSLSSKELMNNGHSIETQYFSIRVNSAVAARDYGRIVIPYNHYYSELELDFANTLSRDGTVKSLAKDALQQRITGGGQDFYSDSSELVFSLPDISAGTILEFQYTRKTLRIPLPNLFSDVSYAHWGQQTVGYDSWRMDYVHNYRYELRSPKSLKLHTKTYAGLKNKPHTTHTSKYISQVWSMNDIATVIAEENMPSSREIYPQLHISSSKDWSIIDAWTWQNVHEKLEPSEQLKSVIKSFNLPTNATNEEKVRAVYNYLQSNVRYVFAHLGRGGYEPHFPSDVIQASYGDCKDQTVLAVALLRMLGVQAYPAVVETPRAGDDERALVSLIFDHMIVHIPADQNTYHQWLDTTGERSLYPGISNYLAKQNVLIVNGKGGNFIRMPTFGKDSATLKMNIVSNSDRTSKADIDIIFDGQFEQHIRSWWIHSNDKENTLNQYLSRIFNSAFKGIYTGEVLHSEDLWTPLTIKAKFNFPDLSDNEKHPILSTSLLQATSLLASTYDLPLPATRKSRYVTRSNFDVILDATLSGPLTSSSALLSQPKDITTPFFTVRNTVKKTDNSINVRSIYNKAAMDLTLPEYKKYYKATEDYNQSKSWQVSIYNDPLEKDAENIQIMAKKNGNDSHELYLAKARHAINKGDFNGALIPAKKAVELNNNNGEAWYILGMAQGFNALMEESVASFAKAESLGYIP